jgi:heme-degrading monooxygenase HmoA
MLVRVVKMEFQADQIESFVQLFLQRKELIEACDGCIQVTLLQDENDSTRFFTLSHWDSDEDLQNYRNSELFKENWSLTKPMFKSKAEAWSLGKRTSQI